MWPQVQYVTLVITEKKYILQTIPIPRNQKYYGSLQKSKKYFSVMPASWRKHVFVCAENEMLVTSVVHHLN